MANDNNNLRSEIIFRVLGGGGGELANGKTDCGTVSQSLH